MVLVYINPPVTIQCLISIHIDLCCQTCTDKPLISGHNHGRTHGAPYCSFGYVLLRFGGNVVRRMGTQQQLPGCLNMLHTIKQ